jgi:Tfp pilus assembly protein PilN
MIKVNLIGAAGKKQANAAVKVARPVSIMPVLLILIVAAFAAAGYWWHSDLTGQIANLDQQIQGLEARKAALEAVIKQDQIYEARKKMLESRVKIIDALQKNQVSPVLALDQLAEAVERTQYVWLSSLDQRDAVLTMNGTGTSLTAIADFYTNLNATGYFRNIDLGPSQESAGNFTFSLKCEFAPPRGTALIVPAVTAVPAPAAGGN